MGVETIKKQLAETITIFNQAIIGTINDRETYPAAASRLTDFRHAGPVFVCASGAAIVSWRKRHPVSDCVKTVRRRSRGVALRRRVSWRAICRKICAIHGRPECAGVTET
jgi:hypothetical protein